jgi:oxygen-independent coproporphyrinogen-3 oxidase
MAQQSGFERINLDLMFGLPGQTPEAAVDDLQQLLAFETGHLSWYQLTIEPNTLFHHHPPMLPDEDRLDDIQQAGEHLLGRHGYEAYEISAWSRPGQQSRHNLNYWGFGDYIGIGAGAHGKLTGRGGAIVRYSKRRNPRDYLATPEQRSGIRTLNEQDRLLEFMLNALRLRQGYTRQQFQQRTGLDSASIRHTVAEACAMGWLENTGDTTRPTDTGRRYLNNLLTLFDHD